MNTKQTETTEISPDFLIRRTDATTLTVALPVVRDWTEAEKFAARRLCEQLATTGVVANVRVVANGQVIHRACGMVF